MYNRPIESTVDWITQKFTSKPEIKEANLRVLLRLQHPLFRLASPSTAPTSTEAPRLPTPTPACQDGLRYLADITVPDGSIVSPGEAIDKQWQVVNSGTCNWNERYWLRRISGPPLDSLDEQALYPARGGTQAVIRVLLVAPPDPGTYRSAWQAYNPQGEPFGDPIFVEILVSSTSP